jgi:hypothetical protein
LASRTKVQPSADFVRECRAIKSPVVVTGASNGIGKADLRLLAYVTPEPDTANPLASIVQVWFAVGRRKVALWQILLQKSLATLLNDDSVALMRFAVEAIDDGAAQSRPR